MCGINRFSYTALVRQIRKLCLAQPECRVCYYVLRGWGHAPPENFFKITCSEIESEGIFYNVYSYRDNSYIIAVYTHIIAIL